MCIRDSTHTQQTDNPPLPKSVKKESVLILHKFNTQKVKFSCLTSLLHLLSKVTVEKGTTERKKLMSAACLKDNSTNTLHRVISFHHI